MTRPTSSLMAQSTLVLLFLLVIFLPFFGTILKNKHEFSPQEKRRLAPLPKVSLEYASLAALPKALEDYCRDHLFLREYLVRLNATLRVRLMDKSPTFMVMVGTDGWYFYCGDRALHDFLGRSDKTDALTTAAWEANIARRAQWMHELGAHYLVAIAPNKENVHSEYLPARFRHLAGTTMLAALRRRMEHSETTAHFLDLSPALLEAKGNAALYYRTDSHWNSRGAFVAYQAIMQRLTQWYPAVSTISSSRLATRHEDEFQGDLTSLMGLAGIIHESVEHWRVEPSCDGARLTSYTADVLPAGMILTVSECPQAQPLRLLVISDSFIEGLQNYLSETFQEVVFSRDTGPAELRRFITQYRPHLVLHLLVARNLPRALGGEQ